MVVPERLRCTRNLAAQVQDPSGAIRRIDHPREEIGRVDLFDDAELDAFQRMHPELSSEALDAVGELADAMSVRLAKLEEDARHALEGRVADRPVLAIVACRACGAYEIARVGRPWPIDRAMQLTGLAEREVRAVLVVLADVFGSHEPARLDELDAEAIRELLGLVGQDYDPESVRERHGRAKPPTGIDPVAPRRSG